MHEDRTERELKSLFRKLKSEEERLAPAFEPLLRSAARGTERTRPSMPTWVRLAGAVAVAAALVIGSGIFPMRPRQPADDLEAWSALSQWTASTDTFLEWSEPHWGSASITTPSDTWMGRSYETEGQQPTRKETL